MARQAEIDVRFLPCTWKQIYCQNGRHLFRRLNLVCSREQVCQHHALLYNTRSENVSRSPSPQPCPYIQVTGPRRHIPVNGAMHSTSEQVLHSHFFGQITETFIILCPADGIALKEHVEHGFLLQVQFFFLFLRRKALPVYVGDYGFNQHIKSSLFLWPLLRKRAVPA